MPITRRMIQMQIKDTGTRAISPTRARPSNAPTRIDVLNTVTNRDGTVALSFHTDKQPVIGFRIAECADVRPGDIRNTDAGVLIRCSTGVISKAVISCVQDTNLTVISSKGGRVLDVQTIFPLPDVAPQVFFTTIGHHVVAVGIGDSTGRIAQVYGCTGQFRVVDTIFQPRLIGDTCTNVVLTVEVAIFDQHQKLSASQNSCILLFPTMTTVLGKFAGVGTGQVLGLAGCRLCIGNAGKHVIGKVCNLGIIHDVGSSGLVPQATFISGLVDVVIFLAIADELRMHLEASLGGIRNVVADFAGFPTLISSVRSAFQHHGNHFVVEFRLFHHDLHLGSHRVGGITHGCSLGQNTGRTECRITLIGNHNTVIRQVAAFSATHCTNLVERLTTSHAHSTSKAGELLVGKVHFHAVNVTVRVAHIGTKVSNFSFHCADVLNGCVCTGIDSQVHVVTVAHGGVKLDVCTGHGNAVVCRHIAQTGSFHTHCIQDFTQIRVFCIQTQATEIIASGQLLIGERRFHTDAGVVGNSHLGNVVGLLHIFQCSQGFQCAFCIHLGRSADLGELNVGCTCHDLCNQCLTTLGQIKFRKFSHFKIPFLINNLYFNDISVSDTGCSICITTNHRFFIKIMCDLNLCGIRSITNKRKCRICFQCSAPVMGQNQINVGGQPSAEEDAVVRLDWNFIPGIDDQVHGQDPLKQIVQFIHLTHVFQLSDHRQFIVLAEVSADHIGGITTQNLQLLDEGSDGVGNQVHPLDLHPGSSGFKVVILCGSDAQDLFISADAVFICSGNEMIVQDSICCIPHKQKFRIFSSQCCNLFLVVLQVWGKVGHQVNLSDHTLTPPNVGI
nr:MAG TPA: hypothetical protein [Caudoviricetes sp.]